MENNNYITGDLKLSPKNNEQYRIDWGKVKTVEDCVLLLKCFVMAFASSADYEPAIYITNYSPIYESIKHLTMNED